MKLRKEDETNQSVPWFIIDAKRTIEEIHQDIVQVAEKIIEEKKNKEIKPLWI
jgi:thymidylate kinase